METKTYTFQEKTFTSKKINLKLRNQTIKLIKKFTDFSQEYIKQTTIKLTDLKEGDEEYIYYQNQLVSDISLAVIAFLSDEDVLKEMFKFVLDGDIDSINYEADTDEKFWQLISFGSEVFNDFFQKSKLVNIQ